MKRISKEKKDELDKKFKSPSDFLAAVAKESDMPPVEFTLEGERVVNDLDLNNRPIKNAKEALQEIAQIKAAQDREASHQPQQPTAPQKGDGGSER